jgi:hypothetical protein
MHVNNKKLRSDDSIGSPVSKHNHKRVNNSQLEYKQQMLSLNSGNSQERIAEEQKYNPDNSVSRSNANNRFAGQHIQIIIEGPSKQEISIDKLPDIDQEISEHEIGVKQPLVCAYHSNEGRVKRNFDFYGSNEA